MMYNKDQEYTLKVVNTAGETKEIKFTPDKDMSKPQVIMALKSKYKNFFKLIENKEVKLENWENEAFNYVKHQLIKELGNEWQNKSLIDIEDIVYQAVDKYCTGIVDCANVDATAIYNKIKGEINSTSKQTESAGDVLTPIPDELKEPSISKPWTNDMYMEYYFRMANAVSQEYKNGDIDYIKERMKNYGIPEQEITDGTIKDIINDIAFAYADEKERKYKELNETAPISGDIKSKVLDMIKIDDTTYDILEYIKAQIDKGNIDKEEADKLIELVKTQSIYECMDCGKEFEYSQANIVDAFDNPSCPFCGSGDVAGSVGVDGKLEEGEENNSVIVLSYGRGVRFPDRKTAIDYYRECVAGTDPNGAENYSYQNILYELIHTNKDVVYDIDDDTEYDWWVSKGKPTEDISDELLKAHLGESNDLSKDDVDKLDIYTDSEIKKMYDKYCLDNKNREIKTFTEWEKENVDDALINELEYEFFSNRDKKEEAVDVDEKVYEDGFVGQPLSMALSYVGDGMDVCDNEYDMCVWVPAYDDENPVNDYYDKAIQYITSQIKVVERFNPEDDSTIVAGITEFVRNNKEALLDIIEVPEGFDEYETEEYLVADVFAPLMSGGMSEKSYEDLYKRLGGK